MVSKKSFVDILKQEMEAVANGDKAPQMAAYMKGHFCFLGVNASDRQACLKSAIKKVGMPDLSNVPEIVKTLWHWEEREFQYAAIDLLQRYKKKYPETWMNWIPGLIVTKSWWDTVDMMASNVVGFYLRLYPRHIATTVDLWIKDENMWLRRTALLFQLKWTDHTDEERLFRYIRLTAHENEFFIAKAVGWALRQYSKTNPEAVRKFMKAVELQPLSVREGSKYLK